MSTNEACTPLPRETSFRLQRTALAGLLLALVPTACGGEVQPADAPAPAPGTPQPASAPGAEPVAAASNEAVADRYSSGLQTLETEYDLSALNASAAPDDDAGHEDHAADDDGHDHADGDGHDHDHDHGSEAQVAAPTQPGGLAPAGTRYLGGISLAEGEKKTYDFGKIREGEAREKTFKFISDGDEALVIKAVKPSCGCTKADVIITQADGTRSEYEKGSEILPGQAFELETAISTEGKHGAFGTSVSIYTNAPGGAFNLKLEAAVEPVLEVLPQPTLFLGQITTADVVEEVLTVKSTRGELFKLEPKAETLPQEVEITLTPTDPDEQGMAAVWEAKITAGPGLPVGVRNYPCALVSTIEIPNPKYATPDGEPKYYTVPIAVQARVTGMVHATPAFVGFGLVRPGQVVERSVRLECFDDFALTADIPVEIGGLYGGEFEHKDNFSLALEPLEDGKMLDVKITLEGLPEDATGSFGGVLQIAVGHPTMESLAVRFSGVCRAGTPTSPGNN